MLARLNDILELCEEYNDMEDTQEQIRTSCFKLVQCGKEWVANKLDNFEEVGTDH